MSYRTYGFILNSNVLFNISNRKLILYQEEGSALPFSIKIVSLNDTQSRLLSFLLHNRSDDIIDKDTIMKNVWDDFSLSSSSQRLWQSINDLRKKLSAVGVEEDIIINVHGSGYRIDESKVLLLHIS
ncbi:helix-turn-helix domain-containing protein [Serratia sp. DD3]|uniref:winged helix-turn-helix domain-containing protein n=1 Tax=Serratia sp. DD3 TaxID=1410619 RepID=UPI0003C524A6|nr:helix-turn-helix domain-containing protein [Serratia sp. DD3]KEY58609.1 DNA-binding transcriptional regulator BaeR [Serratia sp. DD3]